MKPIPKRKLIPVITDLLEYNRAANHTIPYTLKKMEKYGDVCEVSFTGIKNYFIHDPEVIKEILTTQGLNMKRTYFFRAFRKFFGQGLFTSDGELHKQQRRLIKPAFYPQRIEEYANIMVACADEETSSWKDGETININEAMTRITLKVITKAMFSSGLENNEIEEVGKNVRLAFGTMNRILSNPFYVYCLINEIRIPIVKKLFRLKEELDKVINKIIASYRKTADANRKDLLSLLMEAKDEDTGAGMSEEQIRDEVMTFFLAGHETTTLALTWTLYLIGKHPEIENKFFEEVKTNIQNRLPQASDYQLLNFTRNIFRESLRLYIPGEERYGAASFVVNNQGYIATGGNDNGFLDDLWQYDPVTSNWGQKTGLPAGSAQHENQRTEAYSFVIGNKAYLGGGQGFVFGPNGTTNIAFFDLWEYNPLTNTWTQKSDIPDFIGRNMSIAGSINNKAYVGLGCDITQTINRKTFWEYDPATDTWTSKMDFPTDFTTDAGAFVLDSVLYVTGGVNLSPVSLSNQFYKYEPGTNTWTQLTNFNGGAIAGEFAVSTGTKAFVGTGYNASVAPRSDLWEFTNTTSGIEKHDIYFSNDVNVYPNPASDYISIGSKKIISSLEIYDLTGKVVIKEKNNFKDINISELENGVYKLKVIYEDGGFICKPFMKSY